MTRRIAVPTGALPDRALVSVPDIARAAGIAPQTVLTAIHRGALPAAELADFGRTRFFVPREAALDFIHRRTTTPESAR